MPVITLFSPITHLTWRDKLMKGVITPLIILNSHDHSYWQLWSKRSKATVKWFNYAFSKRKNHGLLGIKKWIFTSVQLFINLMISAFMSQQDSRNKVWNCKRWSAQRITAMMGIMKPWVALRTFLFLSGHKLSHTFVRAFYPQRVTGVTHLQHKRYMIAFW